ncbi:hypothetical protein JCM10207_002354 [Rhodosporidiobolus poonsookiae]
MPSLVARLLSPLLVLQGSSFSGDLAAESLQSAQDMRLLQSTSYAVVDGFFVQSSPSFPSDDPTYNPLNDSFGLIDKSASRWSTFKAEVDRLNREADGHTAVKVVWLARHGEGYHNVAERKYGTKAWDDYWSKLNGDGELVWGPDPLLTHLGVSQARAVNHAWKEQQQDGVPLPERLYSSPLSRAASTLSETWEGVVMDGEVEGVRPVFREGLRETMGVHTCDQRKSKSYLAAHYPAFTFEEPFSEQDELWSPTYRETGPEQTLRIRQQLDSIFASDPSTYVSITAHGGVIGAFFRVVGHQKVAVPPGGMIPIVVRGRANPASAFPSLVGECWRLT